MGVLQEGEWTTEEVREETMASSSVVLTLNLPYVGE